MNAKTHISFLLNPTEPLSVAPLPCTPPPSDCAYLHSPQHSPCATTIAATSLALLSAVCINPVVEKKLMPVETPKRKLVDVESEEESGCDESSHSTPTKKKQRTPPCQVEGCPNMAVSRGCCVRHGGGSRCLVVGCKNRAKLYKRCFQHGGYKTCQADNCNRKAKRYGYCWSHGGGRICEIEGCSKVSTQGGLCWAHGGGNRCRLEGCSRRSYQKYNYFCVDHAECQQAKQS
ncbi:hypothetical protein Poli38472_012661 [Pythium oligandrum]|uniref:WRKY19-like zinc finger domain-containing protein n=1 Tax=Pythium oligandrum TaxID=41045 RepID=A0A8K1FFB6_PYTOL|nr:hypothetical protein Poli38472_012661 [Pythium oligandrum]|eukprot:TMW61470.1 hypothetical protein Poli38472_012661 [Pythium oligandrum]